MDVFTNYPPATIIGVLLGVAGAVVAIWKLVDYLWDKIRGHFDKDYHSKQEMNAILDKIALQEANHENNDYAIKALAENIVNWQKTIEEQIEDHGKKIDILIKNDRNATKAWIVSQYHYFTEDKKCIDDFTLDVLSRRYDAYKESGGNSYISLLVNELRNLPKHPSPILEDKEGK